MNEGPALAAAVRATTRRAPMIKQHAARAAHGPAGGRKHQLDQAIIQARALLDDLLTVQLQLGWREDERTEA